MTTRTEIETAIDQADLDQDTLRRVRSYGTDLAGSTLGGFYGSPCIHDGSYALVQRYSPEDDREVLYLQHRRMGGRELTDPPAVLAEIPLHRFNAVLDVLLEAVKVLAKEECSALVDQPALDAHLDALADEFA